MRTLYEVSSQFNRQVRTQVQTGPGGVQLSRGSARGFSLIEILAVILVIALLIGILSVGFGALTGQANDSATKQDLAAIRNAVTSFKAEFGFLPPLVEDGASPRLDRDPAELRIAVYDPTSRVTADADDAQVFLRDETIMDPPDNDRWSEFSLAYYLVGALDEEIDGVEGSGFRKPRTDGTFETRGREYDGFLDAGRGGGVKLELRDTDMVEGNVVVVDRFGTPYRYYRWLPEVTIASQADLNVPAVVGDPDVNQDLRNATFAIVSAGRDMLFGTEDDVMEVGR